MRKIFFKPIKVGGATALISLTSLLSYGIGLFRDRIIAINFGTTASTDTYNASFLIPDILFNMFIAGALTAAFLPLFTEHLVKDKKAAYQIANTMLTGASLLIAALSVIAFIFMPQIIPFFFSDATAQMQADIINMTRLMLPSAILFAISNTLGNILMSYKHFLAYAISPVLYNIGIILGVHYFSDVTGIYAAATGVLIGASLHCLIRLFDIAGTDYKYRPQLKVGHPAFKKILKLMVPKSISLLAWQVNLYIFAITGIKLAEGGLAAFHFARNIQSFAVSLFGIAFATAVFPNLAAAISKNEKQTYTDHIQKTIQRILFFTIPATVGIMVLTEDLVRFILGGGVFDEKSVQLTSIILFFFALSIPFESLSHILARGFYALKNTITPMIINVSAMIIIASITLFVAPKLGIEWFSIGFTIGFAFYVVIMLITLKKHFQKFNLSELVKSLSKTILASTLMAAIILVLESSILVESTPLSTLLKVFVGGGSFFLIAFIVRSPELSSVKYILDRIFKKSTYQK